MPLYLCEGRLKGRANQLITTQIRSALDNVDASLGDFQSLVETSLTLIGSAKGAWSGYLHNLDSGALGVALWHLLSQQHLPLLK